MKEECGTTVLSIAHRLSTLQNCDEIIVMDKGCIVQRGTCREPESAPGCFGTWRWGFANNENEGSVGCYPPTPVLMPQTLKNRSGNPEAPPGTPE